MQLDLSSNFFELFDLPKAFEIDQKELVVRYRELQKQLHPDKFVSRPDAERRWSMQAASLVNEAYQTLGQDLRRAGYLLQLHGIDVDEETDTQMDPMFLMDQMELRESLEMAENASDPQTALMGIRKQLKSSIGSHAQSFSAASANADWVTARSVTRQWQFLDKLLREAKQVEERLDA